MVKASVDISGLMTPDSAADWVSQLWDKYNRERQGKLAEWAELRNYLFATDTSTTSNASLPWKNSTTLPKMTQIRDNLHANYISALFPNSEWLKWEPANRDPDAVRKGNLITDYIINKANNSDFEAEISKCIYDWIDKGNCFGRVTFENKMKENPATGQSEVEYMGPRFYRISPLDIVFNPLADSFEESPKIIRSVRTIGELMELAESNPDYERAKTTLARRRKVASGSFKKDDFDKYNAISVDGFGSMYEYMCGIYVEILEFFGDTFNSDTGEFRRNVHIMVADRMDVIFDEPNRTMLSSVPVFHCGWRTRPDNLWAMGPLDNLVGMQYRIDHLENLKADAMDLSVHPPLKIVGDVEAFEWEPGGKIHISEGDVQEMGKNLNGVITADNQISILEQRMEQYAGAPKEAMGIRTPGEKTAYEVNQLMTAAGRIFQEKTKAFESSFVNKACNAMLAEAIRNFDGSDIIKSVDNEIGAEVFREITKDDLVAAGRLRPVGAQHFATQAILTQNLNNLLNSRAGEMIAPHVDSVRLAQMVEDILGFNRYSLIRPYVAMEQQAEIQRRQGMMQEEMAAREQTIPPV